MTPEDFLEKWLKRVPASREAELFADFKAALTPREGISVESVPNTVLGGRVIVVQCGSYAFEITSEEALRIGQEFQKAASA
jgi:hypothetical protein